MKLRTRITWTTVAVSLPLTATLLALDAHSQQRAAEEELFELARGELTGPDARARCEAGRSAPPTPPGPPPPGAHGHGPGDRRHRAPAELRGYSQQGAADDPASARLSPALLEDATQDPYASSSTLWDPGAVAIVVRTPWGEGPCSYLRATGTKEPWLGALLPDGYVWLLPLGLLFGAIVTSVGPVVRRLGALEAGVRVQASTGDPLDTKLLNDRGEVGALARAFSTTTSKLHAEARARKKQEAALRAFLSDTTHDVMIPLTVLQGHLTQIRSEGGAHPAALLGAMRETHYIASLLHNLGALAKLDQAEPRVLRTSVDVGAVLERVVARHRPIAQELGVELEVSVPAPPLSASADLTLLEQAVSNLVYNAVRHNRTGGHVAVFAETPNDGGFVLHVVDDGPGIAPGDRASLLERGHRGNEARTRAPGGQGLGLSIVRRVCELHGYSIQLDASEAGGLHVRIEGRTPP